MAKIATTPSNLELKSNKVTGTVPTSSWTDTQYPSAKTLYNTYTTLSNKIALAHPVGSVICMSSNTNPSSTIGGTWSLIDKEFEHKFITLSSSNWVASNATFSAGAVALYGHTIMARIGVVPTVNPGDTTTTLGKLNWTTLGLPASMYFGRTQGVAQSDGDGITMCYTWGYDGTISSLDVLNVNGTHAITSPGSYAIYFTDYFTLVPANMPDDLCNKFYFKRTA